MQQEDQQQEPVQVQAPPEQPQPTEPQALGDDPLPEVDFLERAAAKPDEPVRHRPSHVQQPSKAGTFAGLPFSLKHIAICSVLAVAAVGGVSAWLALRNQELSAPPVVPEPDASSLEYLPADLGVADTTDGLHSVDIVTASTGDDQPYPADLTQELADADYSAHTPAEPTPSVSAQQLQALEQQVAALESALAQQQAWNATLEAGLEKAGLLRRAEGQAGQLDVQHFTTPAVAAAAPAAKRISANRSAAPSKQPRRQAPAPQPEAAQPQVKLVSIDMWNGQPSVVVGTTEASLGYRVLQVGDVYRGIALQSADPVTQTAVFLVGGKPQILRKVQ